MVDIYVSGSDYAYRCNISFESMEDIVSNAILPAEYYVCLNKEDGGRVAIRKRDISAFDEVMEDD